MCLTHCPGIESSSQTKADPVGTRDQFVPKQNGGAGNLLTDNVSGKISTFRFPPTPGESNVFEARCQSFWRSFGRHGHSIFICSLDRTKPLPDAQYDIGAHNVWKLDISLRKLGAGFLADGRVNIRTHHEVNNRLSPCNADIL